MNFRERRVLSPGLNPRSLAWEIVRLGFSSNILEADVLKYFFDLFCIEFDKRKRKTFVNFCLVQKILLCSSTNILVQKAVIKKLQSAKCNWNDVWMRATYDLNFERNEAGLINRLPEWTRPLRPYTPGELQRKS